MTWTDKPVYAECRHHKVAIQQRNVQFKDSDLHYLEVMGYCLDCKQVVSFLNDPSDFKMRPTMTEDGVLIRLPFKVIAIEKENERTEAT